MPRPSGLTPAQRRTLFAMIRQAAGELGEHAESYRRRIMAEELGAEHLSQVSPTLGFDTLMARACRDAGDDASAIKYALGATTRLRHLILEAAELIAPDSPLVYVAGVMLQSHTVTGLDRAVLTAHLSHESFWCKLSASQLRRVLAMLKTHLRRER